MTEFSFWMKDSFKMFESVGHFLQHFNSPSCSGCLLRFWEMFQFVHSFTPFFRLCFSLFFSFSGETFQRYLLISGREVLLNSHNILFLSL